jgi:hypothetical protein
VVKKIAEDLFSHVNESETGGSEHGEVAHRTPVDSDFRLLWSQNVGTKRCTCSKSANTISFRKLKVMRKVKVVPVLLELIRVSFLLTMFTVI